MEGSPTPPPAYAAYPRAHDAPMYGTSEKLSRLYRGYCGTSYTFLCGILVYVTFLFAGGVASSNGKEILGYILFVLPVACVVGTFYFSIRAALDIGFASGWPPVAGILLGLFTPIMCLVMCAIMGFIASVELKNYGIKYRSFRGLDKNLVRDTIAKMAEMENSSQPFSSPV